MICNMCPRRCGAKRESSPGFCRSPYAFKIARAALHFWEEPCISGKRGSGAVFFSGCALRCAFCQNSEISLQNKGVEVSEEKLISIFERLISQGAQNINLVNPTHYALQLKELFSKWKCPVPVIYNSGGYDSVETLKELDGLIDIYLPDFKYTRSEKAARYSLAPDYPQTARAAIAQMLRQQEKCVFEGGMMKKGVIIRHLILPENVNTACEVIDICRHDFSGAYLSLMAQYIPCGELSKLPELSRRITRREYQKAVRHALECGVENMFVQELSSAKESYIPPFDFTGVM